MREKRVLGVDPGTSVTGWAVVQGHPGRPERVASGVVKLAGRLSSAERLVRICDTVRELVREHEPEAIGLEKAFVFRNVQSAFRLGEVRGAVLVAAGRMGCPVYEYAPAQVKQAVVGFGQAGKQQIAKGVALLLSIPAVKRADEADALAVAICHLRGRRLREAVGGRG